MNHLKTILKMLLVLIVSSLDGTMSKLLDNHTDTIMLGSALYHKPDSSVLERALNVYRAQYDDALPSYCLLAYVNDYEGVSVASYPRYWHGYLVFLKPLLLFTDYLGFRTLNKILLLSLTAAVIGVLVKRGQKRAVLPFVTAVLFLRPSAVAYSLQYSTIFYTSITALLVMVLWNEKLKQGHRFLFFFLILGILTNYLDFLTYPIATLGFSAAMYLCLQDSLSCREKLRSILLYSLAWALGYFGMWIAKWSLASLLLRENVFADALKQAQFRMSDSISGHVFTRLDVFSRNFMVGFDHIEVLACVIFTVTLLYGIWVCGFHIKRFLLHGIPYVLVCLMPFAWYTVLQNHSFVHPAFTYRSLAVFVFAFLCMGITAPRAKK